MRCPKLKVFLLIVNMLIYGYFMGSPVYYGDAVRAENYVNNIDYQLNLLKGSSQNDGLVALENQYYPKSMHNNVLLGGEEGYEGFPKLNHKNIKDDETVRDKIEKMADLATKRGQENEKSLVDINIICITL